MKTLKTKLDWLNLHCNNRFSIIALNSGKNFHLMDKKFQYETFNLTRYKLNKKLDILENLLSNGYI